MKIKLIVLAAIAFIAYQIYTTNFGSPDFSGSSSNNETDLVIVSGSENEALEPIIQKWANDEKVNISIVYQGSVDIYRSLQQGTGMPFDAVWPANSLWIELGDSQKVVKHAQSVMRSPVILGIKKSIAEELGWDKNPVKTQDILTATEENKFRLSMTSATQSNSGSSAYLGFLYAMSGYPNTLTQEHLNDLEVQKQVKRILATVNRSSGSSGWLKNSLVDNPQLFDAMYNYEAMIIEANQTLASRGAEPLCAVYPEDGLMVADSPLGFVSKGDSNKEKLFLELQEHLLSTEVQNQIEGMGRRTGLLGMTVNNPDKAVWNPNWCINTDKEIASIPVPKREVIEDALFMYQTDLRKPSLTVWVLDVSGSMEGHGIINLREAMSTLLDTNLAREHLLQMGSNDVAIIIPFSNHVQEVWTIKGNKPEQLQTALSKVQKLTAGGGTDLYKALGTALNELKPYNDDNTLWDYLPSIIAMTDGRSDDGNYSSYKRIKGQLPYGSDIPIHAIAFGDADKSQMEAITKESVGRLFSTSDDLPSVLRKAKGYN